MSTTAAKISQERCMQHIPCSTHTCGNSKVVFGRWLVKHISTATQSACRITASVMYVDDGVVRGIACEFMHRAVMVN